MRELVLVLVLGLGLVLCSTIWTPCICTHYLPCNHPYTCIAISQNTVMCKFSATYICYNFCGVKLLRIANFHDFHIFILVDHGLQPILRIIMSMLQCAWLPSHHHTGLLIKLWLLPNCHMVNHYKWLFMIHYK